MGTRFSWDKEEPGSGATGSFRFSWEREADEKQADTQDMLFARPEVRNAAAQMTPAPSVAPAAVPGATPTVPLAKQSYQHANSILDTLRAPVTEQDVQARVKEMNDAARKNLRDLDSQFRMNVDTGNLVYAKEIQQKRLDLIKQSKALTPAEAKRQLTSERALQLAKAQPNDENAWNTYAVNTLGWKDANRFQTDPTYRAATKAAYQQAWRAEADQKRWEASRTVGNFVTDAGVSIKQAVTEGPKIAAEYLAGLGANTQELLSNVTGLDLMFGLPTRAQRQGNVQQIMTGMEEVKQKQTGGDPLRGAVYDIEGAIPDAVLMMLMTYASGGGTAVAGGAEAFAKIMSNTTRTKAILSGLGQMMRQTMVAAPEMIPMMVKIAATSEVSNKAAGMTDEQAFTAAILNAYGQSLLEGGGINEAFKTGGLAKVGQFVKANVGEGFEEVYQNWWERSINAIVGGKPLPSFEEIAKEDATALAGGLALGSVMGGTLKGVGAGFKGVKDGIQQVRDWTTPEVTTRVEETPGTTTPGTETKRVLQTGADKANPDAVAAREREQRQADLDAAFEAAPKSEGGEYENGEALWQEAERLIAKKNAEKARAAKAAKETPKTKEEEVTGAKRLDVKEDKAPFTPAELKNAAVPMLDRLYENVKMDLEEYVTSAENMEDATARRDWADNFTKEDVLSMLEAGQLPAGARELVEAKAASNRTAQAMRGDIAGLANQVTEERAGPTRTAGGVKATGARTVLPMPTPKKAPQTNQQTQMANDVTYTEKTAPVVTQPTQSVVRDVDTSKMLPGLRKKLEENYAKAKDRESEVMALARKGKDRTAISKALGMHPAQVRAVLQMNGVPDVHTRAGQMWAFIEQQKDRVEKAKATVEAGASMEKAVTEDGKIMRALNSIEEEQRIEAVRGLKRGITRVSDITSGHRYVQQIARFLGKHVVFYEGGDSNGFQTTAAPDTLFVRYSERADTSLMFVTGHEFLHSLRQDNEALYNGLKSAFEASLTTKQIETILDRYKAEDRGYYERLKSNRDLLIEEIIADQAGNMFTDKAFWDKVYSYDTSLGNRLLQFAKKFLDQLLEYVGAKAAVDTDVLAEAQLKELYDKFSKIVADRMSGGSSIGSFKEGPVEKTFDDGEGNVKNAISRSKLEAADLGPKETAVKDSLFALETIQKEIKQVLSDMYEGTRRIIYTAEDRPGYDPSSYRPVSSVKVSKPRKDGKVTLSMDIESKVKAGLAPSQFNVHNINEVLESSPELRKKLQEIQRISRLAGADSDFLTDDGYLRASNIETALNTQPAPEPDKKIQGPPETTRKQDLKVKMWAFWRGLGQSYLDQLNPKVFESTRAALVAVTEEAYKNRANGKALGGMPSIVGATGTTLERVVSEGLAGIQSALRGADKTWGALSLNSLCPMFTIGNHGCYLDGCYLTQMANGATGVNLFTRAMYTGEILQISDEEVANLNRTGGLRFNGVGDTTDAMLPQWADAIRHAKMRGLNIKIITKQKSTFDHLRAIKAMGVPLDHVMVQPSMDHLWVPALLDDAKQAGVRGGVQFDNLISETVASGRFDAAEFAYESIYGRETKIVDGVLFRKYGFTEQQVKDMAAEFKEIQILPRYVVANAQEIAEMALRGEHAIFTLMHGKVEDGLISDYPGNLINFGSLRHIVKKDVLGWHFLGETNNKEKKLVQTAPYKEVEDYIKNNYTPEQQETIFTRMKKVLCCQGGTSLDACMDCAAHGAVCSNRDALYGPGLTDVEGQAEVDQALPGAEPETVKFSTRRVEEIDKTFGKDGIRGSDGSLLPLYHGTRAGSIFTEFETSTNYIDTALGIHMAVDPAVANTFADPMANSVARKHAPRVYQAFARGKVFNLPMKSGDSDTDAFNRLALKAAMELDYDEIVAGAIDEQYDVGGEKAMKILKAFKNGQAYSNAGGFPDEYNIDDFVQMLGGTAYTVEFSDILRKHLQSRGYGAVQYLNTNPYETKGAKNPICYVILDPKSIKSPYSENPVDLENADIRYSTRKAAIEEAFKDSKVRNEDGSLKLVYHGTKKAFNAFTGFMPNFFTEDKGYAKVYGDRIVPAYLNITKPFDTATDEAARQIYNESFVPAMRSRYPEESRRFSTLNMGAMVPFTAADYLFSFLKQGRRKGNFSYDGMYVDEGDTAAIAKANTRTAVVPLDNTQIKSPYSENPVDLENADIRYSLRQEYSSADTSINQIPGLHRAINWISGTTNIDYGGGKFDKATDYLKTLGVTSFVHDAFNRTAEHNADVEARMAKNPADTGTIANVLNVIKEPEIRADVIRKAASMVKPGGVLYISVYEGNRSGVGAPSSKGWQNNRKTADYLAEVQAVLPGAVRKGEVIMAPVGEAKGSVRKTEMFDKAAKHFGTTRDFREAGYLLPDGRMLDFSGRHEGQVEGGERYVDHRDIQDVYDDLTRVDAMVDFMKSGAIRLMPESPGIEIIGMPTPEQASVIRTFVMRFHGGVQVDLGLPEDAYNSPVESLVYPKGTRSDRVLTDIKQFYATGAVRRSLVADFHTMDSVRKTTSQYMATKAPSARRSVFDGWTDFYSKMFNKAVRVEQVSKQAGMMANNALASGGIVRNIIERELVDRQGNRIGKSWAEVVKDVVEDGEFWDYMLTKHNISRQLEGKPVIDEDPQVSYLKAEQMEQAHPEWVAKAQEIYDWQDTFMRAWALDTGIIDPITYADWRMAYPHYIPTQREFSDLELGQHGAGPGRKYVNMPMPVKRATGSDRKIIPPIYSVAQMVNTMVRTAAYNDVGKALYDQVLSQPDPKVTILPMAAVIFRRNLDNVVTVWKDGIPHFMQIEDKPLLDALLNLPKRLMMPDFITKISGGYRGLITHRNPVFAALNFARDAATAYVFGKEWNPLAFARDAAIAAGQIMQTGLYELTGIGSASAAYNRYRAVGGGGGGFLDVSDTKKLDAMLKPGARKKLNQIFDTLTSGLGEVTEQMWRLSAFNREMRKSGNVEQALADAMNVTVNFARGGSWAKNIDPLMPYTNAYLQGVDTFVRRMFVEAGAPARWAKAVGIVTAPALIQLMMIAAAGEDEWDRYLSIKRETRDAYYHFPKGDGTYVRIPKSRELGVLFGAMAERIVTGDFEEMAKPWFQNFAPNNPFESNLLGGAWYLAKNETFSGATITPEYMKSLEADLQSDENTSSLMVALAKVTGVGAKDLQFLFDHYSGIIGDILLPLTAQSGRNTALDVLRRVTTDRFTTDPAYSSQGISDFYEAKDAAEKAARTRNERENIPSKTFTPEENFAARLGDVSEQISDGNKYIRTLKASDPAVRQIRETTAKYAARAAKATTAADLVSINAQLRAELIRLGVR